MKQNLSKEVGNRIRKLREQKGMTQEELAYRVKCHRTYVGMVERAEKNISVAILSHFASALETTMADLLEGL